MYQQLDTESIRNHNFLIQGIMISGKQVRMARAALEIGVRDLAHMANVNPNTVSRLETGGGVQSSNLEAIESALESGGIIFIPADDQAGAGVRLKK